MLQPGGIATACLERPSHGIFLAKKYIISERSLRCHASARRGNVRAKFAVVHQVLDWNAEIRIWELEALEKSYNAKARVYWQRSPRVLITLHFAQGLASDRPLGLVMQENSLNNPIQDAIVRQHEGDGSRRKLR